MEELFEIGTRAGFQEGEIGDAIHQTTTRHSGQEEMLPDSQTLTWLGTFVEHSNPEYRNFTALDLVVSELRDCVRAVGAASARVDRSVIVERAVAQRIPRNDIEAAITILTMTNALVEKDGTLKFAPGLEGYPPPSQHRRGLHVEPQHDEMRASAYSFVKDVIERRTDSRPKHAEPLDAFVEELGKLGYGPFRSWWVQIVSELRRADTQSSPVSVIVLAAALVEGALTFVVKHAQGLGVGVLGSKDFVRDPPRQWRIDDLVSSATAGGNTAILDIAMRQRAKALIHARQRIHAGRMLSEFPAGPPDLRPEEAREAKATSELVVRRVLGWLEKYPPQQARKG